MYSNNFIFFRQQYQIKKNDNLVFRRKEVRQNDETYIQTLSQFDW